MMNRFGYIFALLIIIPALGFGQLKKNVGKPNISESLEYTTFQDAMVGFLDPSRFTMGHSISMSYTAFGGGGAMINSYINTLNYKFSEELFLTTKIGIMNSPYNSLPGNSYLNDVEFFGGAELKWLPSKDSAIFIRFEKAPAYYNPGFYRGYRSPFGFNQSDW
jgi:hypothetical protein